MHDDVINVKERLDYARRLAAGGNLEMVKTQISLLDLVVENIPDISGEVSHKKRLRKELKKIKEEIKKITESPKSKKSKWLSFLFIFAI